MRLPDEARFFIALRPDAPARYRLGQLAEDLALRCRGRPIAAADLHLTLAFVGTQPRIRAAHFAHLLAGLPGSAPRTETADTLLPSLSIDAIGMFGPRLLWAGPEYTPAWLETLATTVRSKLDAAGVAYDRKPFRPHITLVRNAGDRQAAQVAQGRWPATTRALQLSGLRLVLGANHEAPTAQRRYRWWLASAATADPG